MKRFVTTALIGSTLLAACGPGIQTADDRYGAAQQRADAGIDAFGAQQGVRSGGVQLSDRAFVAAQRAPASQASRLPSSVQGSGAVVLQSREPMSLRQIAVRLSEITKIPHSLSVGPTGIEDNAAGADATAAADPFGVVAPAEAAVQTFTEKKIRPNLRGPLSSVLDEVAAAFEVEWAYANGRVLLRDFVTRQYQISALPFGEETTALTGGNGVEATTTATSDLWAELGEAIRNMLSEGSNVAFGKSSGTVTLTARVGDHARVADFIRATNERVGQQVAFDINVITVVLNNEDAFGVDLSAAFARTGVSIDILGRPNLQSGLGVANIGITEGNVSVSLVARALSQFGRVSVETRAGTTTANNRVAPIEVVDQVAYLKETSIQDALSGNGEVSERVTRVTDTVTTGFQMQLTPRILNTRDIMVQYAVRISELNALQTFGEGNEAVQLPEVSTTSFQQQAVIENGQTLVMAGFERKRVERDSSNGGGLLRAARSEEARTQRVATVLMITPTLLRR